MHIAVLLFDPFEDTAYYNEKEESEESDAALVLVLGCIKPII
jgi:hypothetical protein